MRDVVTWVAIALAGIVVIGLIFGGGDAGPVPAPEFTLENLDGTPISITDYRGQVVLLDFWATWCRPCRKSFPALHELQRAYEDEGVVLLVVSIDKTAQAAREYLEANGYPTDTVLWQSLEAAREVKALYGVVGIPRTIVIDREGIIRFSGHPDNLTDEDIEQLL